jgi:16S rRNA (guanine527-N7)-methyltransferase
MSNAVSTTNVPDNASPFSVDDFQTRTNVSRETLAHLERYGALLEKWQKAINLVGNSTIPDLWRRHMLDSWQLLSCVSQTSGNWLDLGSGAGFPALVVAIVSDFEVHAVESDQRKCLFMQNVSRETLADLIVHRNRIEEMAPFSADVISARALAPLEKLLEYANPFAHEKTEFLFLKGQDVDEELTKASKCWNMRIEKYRSLTSDDGCIVKLTEVSRHS